MFRQLNLFYFLWKHDLKFGGLHSIRRAASVCVYCAALKEEASDEKWKNQADDRCKFVKTQGEIGIFRQVSQYNRLRSIIAPPTEISLNPITIVETGRDH